MPRLQATCGYLNKAFGKDNIDGIVGGFNVKPAVGFTLPWADRQSAACCCAGESAPTSKSYCSPSDNSGS